VGARVDRGDRNRNATPQPQTSAATSVLGPLDLALRDDLVSALRLMPGTFVVQTGQLGRANFALCPRRRFGRQQDSARRRERGRYGRAIRLWAAFDHRGRSAEVYRGPNSSLYGAGAASGVVSLTTPHGTTSFPSLLFEGDAGNFNTSREQLEVAGAHNKLDYLGAFSWLQTANDLPMDEYHVATTAANMGWQPKREHADSRHAALRRGCNRRSQRLGLLSRCRRRTQKDQDLFMSGSIDNQTTPAFTTAFATGSRASASNRSCGIRPASAFPPAVATSLPAHPTRQLSTASGHH
jgi:vitamin B12 transporter